jgi:hypothetical protein
MQRELLAEQHSYIPREQLEVKARASPSLTSALSMLSTGLPDHDGVDVYALSAIRR